jgi:hypothetical protein
MKMVLDASTTNPVGKWKSLTDVPKTNPREIQTNSLILAKNPQTNQPILALMEMVFGCIQNQSLGKCEEISQFIAYEKEMQTN